MVEETLEKMVEEVKRRKVKQWCERSLLNFTSYMFYEVYGRKFDIQPFHRVIADKLDKVARLEIKRLIINIPPGGGKTELAVKMFKSYILALRPNAKSIHVSYSDKLALDNATKTREYVKHPAYQSLWPMNIKQDQDSKAKWYTDKFGGMYSTAAGGAVTGFGVENGGCMIIDDPLKADDASSEVKRDAVNNRWLGTLKSRLRDPDDTSAIVIMQRLHEDDLSGFLMAGNGGEEWEELVIPVYDEQGKSIWEQKFPIEDMKAFERADPYTFAGQYMQRPAPLEGGIWKRDWFEIMEPSAVPNDITWECFVDGAYTKNTANDPSGITIAGKSQSTGLLYIKSSIDKWMEFPQLIEELKRQQSMYNISLTLVEPKATGQSIVQVLHENGIPAMEIKSKFGKVSKEERALTSSSYIEGGLVKLIKGNWNEHYLHQVTTFPNAKHDEHVDTTSYAIERHLLIERRFISN